jgi:hypothetical protein
MDNYSDNKKPVEPTNDATQNDEKLLEAKVAPDMVNNSTTALNSGAKAVEDPMQVAAPTIATSSSPRNAPLTLLVQWLMYAFYGWTILALNYLIGSDIFHYLGGNATSSFDSVAIYAVTATLVLLAIAVTANLVYAKREPQQKSGAASAIMIIHALIFAILGIGSLIAAVFILVAYFVSPSADGKAAISGVTTALFSLVLYAMAFIRTINPIRFKWINKSYLYGMLALTSVFVILSVIGPVASQFKSKNDTLITDNLYTISAAINEKATADGNLPTSLSSLGLSSDAKTVIDKKLITYIPNSLSSSSQYDFYYELCAKFVSASSGFKSLSTNSQDANKAENYSSYPIFSEHPAGNYCYMITSSGNFMGNSGTLNAN